jgi:DNA-binding NtrC family response regulator
MTSPATKGRVLVVEDEEPTKRALAIILRRAGYAVSCAESGANGLELLDEALNSGSPFTALVSDVEMPGMRGTELIALAHKRAPNLPVLVITGYTSRDMAEDLEEEGCVLLAKPFDGDELLEQLERIAQP